MILVIYAAAITFAFYMLQKIRLQREAEHERRIQRFEKLMERLKKVNENVESKNKTRIK